MNPRYPTVARRADNRCEYCRAPEVVTGGEFEVEHVYPASRGGSNDPSNLALSCRACNLRKGDATDAPDPATGEIVALFDPRSDRWAVHFRIDPDTWGILGGTPTGRATVEKLGMNAPRQLTARALWSGLGLFP